MLQKQHQNVRLVAVLLKLRIESPLRTELIDRDISGYYQDVYCLWQVLLKRLVNYLCNLLKRIILTWLEMYCHFGKLQMSPGSICDHLLTHLYRRILMEVRRSFRNAFAIARIMNPLLICSLMKLKGCN